MGQLEIISPNGDIGFFTLDEEQGITNIGRHPTNDIVLSGPGVHDFHAIIDHRQFPCQLLLLTHDPEARLSAGPLTPNVYCDLRYWDTVELGGFTLLFVANVKAELAPSAQIETSTQRQGAPPSVVPSTARPLDSASLTQAADPEAERPADATPAISASHRHLISPRDLALPPPPLRADVQPGRRETAETAEAERTREVTNWLSADESGPGQPIPDVDDDIIVTELAELEQIIDVEQTALWQLTVVNGGPIVATFDVYVEGWVDESWVTVTPPTVNLNEGERAAVQIAITPPRTANSRAGIHHIALVATSPNHPTRCSRRGASLFINPYFEYSAGELSPKQQTLSYFKPFGELSLPLQNKSNTDVTFRLDGTDDQMGTTFEFFLPGQEAGLVRQAELKLAPQMKVDVPMRVTPNVRKMVGAGSRNYALTVTTTLVEGDLAPRSMLGQLKSRPLVGPLLITVIGLGIAFLALFIMRPTIEQFGFVPETVQNLKDEPTAQSPTEAMNSVAGSVSTLKPPNFLGIKLPKLPKPVASILKSFGISSAEESVAADLPHATARAQAGSEVALFWQSSRSATSLSIDKEVSGSMQPFRPAIQSPAGQERFVADTNAVYILRAENWITNLPFFGDLFGLDERKVVLVTDPLVPQIINFEADTEDVVVGESVQVRWNIADADTYTLQVNGVPQTLTEASGTLEFQPQENTTFTLIADSPYAQAPVQKPLQIVVSTPTPTAVPTPLINLFGASPDKIVAGESIRLDWSVEGADTVTIDPLGPAASVEGFREEVLTEAKTWVFTLNAEKLGSQSSRSVQVQVIEPTPTASPTVTPQQPVVQVFDLIPNEVVAGSEESKNLKAKWTVIGDYTDIQISSPEFGPIANLARDGSMKLPATQSTVYQITVYLNGEVVTSLTKELTVLEPTPTFTATPTATPEPSATPLPTSTPTPNIVYFRALGDPEKVAFMPDSSPPTYGVLAGTQINLSWKIENATVVELLKEGPQPPEVLDFQRVVTVDTEYRLQANSGEGAPRYATIKLVVTPPPPPPIPSGVTGQYVNPGTPATLYWAYRGEVQDDIIGFRVYRAGTSDFAFARVADWGALPNDARSWQDTLVPSCGYAYYVVAVYEDITQQQAENRLKETATSGETWVTEQCPQ